MSLTDIALAMIGGTLVAFLLFQAIALVAAMRRPSTASDISVQARMLWTLVPLAMVALMLGSLFMTGRITL